METEERQFLLTTAWMFARHGQDARARILYEALAEDDPRDGVTAAALAERLLEDGEPAQALETLRAADFPRALDRVEALLETRALRMLGRHDEATRRWRRFVSASRRTGRSWVAEA